MKESERAGVLAGSLWMVGISLVLFFLPLVNGLIGGAVGGWRTGSVKRALGAAVLPALVVSAALWVIIAVFGAPVLGLAAGAAVGILILLADLGLFVGALVGGWAAQSRHGTAQSAGTGGSL